MNKIKQLIQDVAIIFIMIVETNKLIQKFPELRYLKNCQEQRFAILEKLLNV